MERGIWEAAQQACLMHLIVEREANNDITSTAEWYEEQEKGVGVAFLDELNGVLQRILRNPKAFSLRQLALRGASLKKFPYTIYYKHENEVIQIIAVLHHRRDSRTLAQRIN